LRQYYHTLTNHFLALLLNKREFGISILKASPQPLSSGEGLITDILAQKYGEVLSFGEDLGEANRVV